MGAVVALKPRWHSAIDDGRRAFDLFPRVDSVARVWLYAVCFTDGRVKIGIASRPRDRMCQYWGAVGGAIEWAHLFARPQHTLKTGVCPTEKAAVIKAAKVSQRIGRSEYFRGLSRVDALRCVREAIAEAA